MARPKSVEELFDREEIYDILVNYARGADRADVDLIAAGDVFYNAEVAASMLPFLQRCQDAGIDVLIGDPDRRDLPITRLERVASYPVGDVGDARDKAERRGAVYRLRRL